MNLRALLTLVTRSSRTVAAAERPDADALSEAAALCRTILTGNIQPFYIRAAAPNAAGYLEDAAQGRFFDRGERLLMMQTRYLWYFSTALEAGIEPDANRRAADQGFRFLRTAHLDREFGGYFERVDPAGIPVKDSKDICQHGFALYAFARYGLATGNAAAQDAADELFALIDGHAHDAANGGYREHFARNWEPLRQGVDDAHSRLLTGRSLNAQMHLLEAFTEYARLSPGPVITARIEELLHILTHAFRHPEAAGLLNRWTSDWQPLRHHKNRQYSHGHDLELIWFVFDAARLLGKPEREYLDWAEGLAAYAMECSYDAGQGGLFDGGQHGAPADRRTKEWWAQAEALIGWLELYRLTKHPAYWSAFTRTLELIRTRVAAADGGWYRMIDERGAPVDERRAWEWQGPYHSGRAMLRCAAMLEELASP